MDTEMIEAAGCSKELQAADYGFNDHSVCAVAQPPLLFQEGNWELIQEVYDDRT